MGASSKPTQRKDLLAIKASAASSAKRRDASLAKLTALKRKPEDVALAALSPAERTKAAHDKVVAARTKAKANAEQEVGVK